MEFAQQYSPAGVQMLQKTPLLSFLGRRSLVPRPLSEATEIFDTDNEYESDCDDFTLHSLDSLDRDSQTTISTPDRLNTPTSADLGDFDFHFEEKAIKGPSGPHLFRTSSEMFEDAELCLSMSPMIAVTPPMTPVARPFSSLNRAVAELDETQVRSWSPVQVASWMREAGFERSVVEKFLTHDISGVVLLDLQFEDLKELDITSYGKRHRVMSSIQHLRTSSMFSPEPPLCASTPRLGRSQSTVQRAPQPEERTVLAVHTESGLKAASPTGQRRGRRHHNDPITPAESVSIVAIEQIVPQQPECQVGECTVGLRKSSNACQHWRRYRRAMKMLQEEYPEIDLAATTSVSKPSTPTTLTGRSSVGAVPSVVASSVALGANPPEIVLSTETLSAVESRDPQDNVRQFLNFQHLKTSPPESTLALPLARNLRNLPRLTIPLAAPASQGKTPVSASRKPTPLQAQLAAQLQQDPYHYGGVASPADIYRVGTPYSATDIPVTAYPAEPLARDASQSVPPNMLYGASSASPISAAAVADPIPRPSSARRAYTRRPSFSPTVAPVSEAIFSVRPPTLPRPEPEVMPLKTEDVQRAGWMRKRKTTRLLRHEWEDSYFSLKGTQLAMHDDEPLKAVSAAPAAVIDVNEYSIACSSVASSSKLSAAFKKSILLSSGSGSSKAASLADGQAFAFSLIPETDKAKRMFSSGSHHFSVKSRDERIEWMRDLMLAKALKRGRANGHEVRVSGNMI